MDAISKIPMFRARVPRPIKRAALPLAMAAAIAASASPAALAQVSATQLPTGGSIAGGTGTINAASGASQVITQTSNRMALTWSTFDIGSAATVTFNQPSSSAAVLNLVQGGNPTQIFGNLNANGQVFLINSNGMIFGSTAQFNVGGLVASTLGTTASDFMSGNDVLDAGANTVALMSNSGTINAAAGAVDLIGGKVVNSGTITASAGNINLVGADKVTLTFESGGFGVVVDKALQLQLDSVAVDNSGTLSAPGGIITLQARAAQGLFDQLINNSGTITAAALSSGSDGSVSLVANGSSQTSIGGSGSIDVGSGAISISADRSVQQSGTYTAGILGGSIGGNASFSGSNRIATLGTLDVSGTLGLTNAIDLVQSGALMVGGSSGFSLGSHALTLDNAGNDFGQAVGLSSGSTTIVDSGALILGTLATGNLTATSGGALNLGSGTVTGTLGATSNGGAITQSASNPLTVTGTSNLNAGSGAITLQQSANDFGGAVSLTGSGIALTDANALTIGALTLGSNSALSLNAGGTLTLPTSAINTGSANLSLHSGNVLATAAALSGTNVSLSGGAGLTLAHDVSATGALALTTANSAIVQSAGALTVTGISGVNAGTGAIALTGAGNAFGQAVSLTGGTTAITASGALILGTLATGSLTATSQGALNLGSGTVNGTLAATSNGGAITQAAALNVSGASTINAGSGAIALTQQNNDFQGAVGLTGTGIGVRDSNNLVVSSLNGGANGAIALTAGGTLSLPAQNLDTGTGALSLVADGGALSTTGDLTGGNISLRARDGLNLNQSIIASGTLGLNTTNSAMTQSAGALSVGARTTIDAGSGAVVLAQAGNDFAGAVGITAGSVQIADANALTLDASQLSGSLRASSGGDLHLAGTVRASNADLAVGGIFFNDAGTTALDVSGRWRVYLATPSAGHVFGGLDSGNTAVWNTGAFGTVAVTGNRYVFAFQPTLHWTSTDLSKTYGDSIGVGNAFTVSGLMSGVAGAYRADALTDVVTGAPSLDSLGSAAAASVAGGPYAIQIAQGTLDASGSGYALAFDSLGRLTVDRAWLTVTAADAGKTYGQTAALSGYTVDGLRNGDAVASLALASAGTPATANVGDYLITASNADGTGLSNYDITYVDGVLSVGKAGLTITAGNAAKTYGQAGTLGDYRVDGLVNADAVASVDLASAGTAATANVGDYTITASNADGTGLSNYDITYVDGVLSVGKAGLTITAGNAAKTYGQAGTLSGYRVDGLVNADAVASVDLASAGTAATANVGDYTITASNADGTGLSNYDITYVDGVLSVGKAGLTITAGNAAKTYGQAGTLSGYRVDGLVNADAVASLDLASAGTAATANVGDYTITASNADGTGLSNYDITYVDGVLSVGKAGLTITAGNAAKTYGQAGALGGYRVDGLVNADAVASVDLASAGTAATANVGDYTIAASNADGTGLSNYDITYVDGVLSVGKAGLTITASDETKRYGVAARLERYNVAGLLNDDTVASVSLTSEGAPAGAARGNYLIRASDAAGTGLSNYEVSYVDGTLAVIDAVPSSGVAAIGAETLAARQQPVPPRQTGQTPGPIYRISEEGLALPEQCQHVSTSGRACTDR